MDYFTAFEISKSGLVAEKTRMDVVALNIANSNSVVSDSNKVYKPMKVFTGPKSGNVTLTSFQHHLATQQNMGVDVLSVEELAGKFKKIHEPKNPYADSNGYVYRPDINPASEMIDMMSALRAYQANIKAISATKAMANEALRIGAK